MLTAPFLPFFDPTFNTLGLYKQAGRASKFTGSHGKNRYSAFSLKFHIGHIENPIKHRFNYKQYQYIIVANFCTVFS